MDPSDPQRSLVQALDASPIGAHIIETGADSFASGALSRKAGPRPRADRCPRCAPGFRYAPAQSNSASPSPYLVQQAATDGPELTATSGPRLLAKAHLVIAVAHKPSTNDIQSFHRVAISGGRAWPLHFELSVHSGLSSGP